MPHLFSSVCEHASVCLLCCTNLFLHFVYSVNLTSAFSTNAYLMGYLRFFILSFFIFFYFFFSSQRFVFPFWFRFYTSFGTRRLKIIFFSSRIIIIFVSLLWLSIFDSIYAYRKKCCRTIRVARPSKTVWCLTFLA